VHGNIYFAVKMGDVEIPPLVKQIVRGLRGLAFLATILATSFMACSHERAIFPFDYKADYTDLMLFKYVTTTYISFLVFYYFVVCFWSMHALSNLYKKKKSMIFRAFLGANIAASLYSFFFVCLPPKSLLWRLAIVLDVVTLSCMVF
jgi:hypothetical protein